MKETLNSNNRKTLLNRLNNLYIELAHIKTSIANEIARINQIENKKELKEDKRKEYLFNSNNYLFNMTINQKITETNIKFINEIITENEY